MNATNPDTCRFWRSVFGIQQAYRAGTTTEQEATVALRPHFTACTVALRPHFTACNDTDIKTFLNCDVEEEKKL